LLTIEYDEDSIPEGISENSLYIATWNKENQEWERVECTCDTEADCINTCLDHFSIYTIMVNTRPAEFQLSELTMTPDEVYIDRDVTISVMVTNIGDLTGNYGAILQINYVVKETREITLAGSDNVTVSFSMTPDAIGEYAVNIGGLLGTFNVKTPEIPPAPTHVPTVAPSPASFTISDLSVTPSEVKPSEEVTISAVVTNAGGCDGNCVVCLKIDGIEEAKKEVTVGAGKSETVTFIIAKDTKGSYTASIDDKTGQFTVIVPQPSLPKPTGALPVQPPNDWWRIVSIIAAGVVIIGLLVYFFVWRKRIAPRPS